MAPPQPAMEKLCIPTRAQLRDGAVDRLGMHLFAARGADREVFEEAMLTANTGGLFNV